MGREDLTGNDWLFLLGLGVFILFLALAHPLTPEIRHGEFLFWAAVTALVISMAPDYVDEEEWRERAKEWGEGDAKMGRRETGPYRYLLSVKRYLEGMTGERYLGIALALASIGIILYAATGRLNYVPFGAAYGVAMKALLI